MVVGVGVWLGFAETVLSEKEEGRRVARREMSRWSLILFFFWKVCSVMLLLEGFEFEI